MKLRWLVLCNEHGLKTEPCLQYNNDEGEDWEDVEYVEMKSWEYEE